jgi:hypothetical protein
MNVSSINLEKVSFDIDKILNDVKQLLDDNPSVNISQNNLSHEEIDRSCKIFETKLDSIK